MESKEGQVFFRPDGSPINQPMPGTQMGLKKGLVLMDWPSEIEVIGAPGMYKYIYIYIYGVAPSQ